MYGEVKKAIGEILRKLCEMKGVTLIEGAVCKDHVHMYVSIPPKLAVSEFMGYTKGKSALMLFDKFPQYKAHGQRNFWARGYYAVTVGNVNEITIRDYIKEQEENDKLEDGGK
jgi:putative transposase